MITYLVIYNRASRSLNGLEQFDDLDAAIAARDAAELKNLNTGEDFEISLVDRSELDRYTQTPAVVA